MQYFVLAIITFCSLQATTCLSSQRQSEKLPWIAVIKEGKIEEVIARLKEGEDPNQRDAYGTPLLHWAASYDKEGKLVKLLIEKNAAIDTKDLGGWTPFDWADKQNNRSAMQHLIEKAIDIEHVNIRCQNGKSLLHCAVQLDGGEINKIVRDLLALGLDPNEQDNIGATSLHYAALNKNIDIEVVKILLKAGADTTIKNEDDATPLDYAKREDVIVKFFLNSNITRPIRSNG